MALDKTGRAKVETAYDVWVTANIAWKSVTDADKEFKKTDLDTKYGAFKVTFPLSVSDVSAVKETKSSCGSNTFIVISVVLVLAANVGGGLQYKMKQSNNKKRRRS